MLKKLSLPELRRTHRLVAQPIVLLRSGTTVGYELLSRFDDTDVGSLFKALPPDQRATLDLFILRKALALIDRVREEASDGQFYSVNLDATSLVDNRVRDLISRSAHPDHLVVEIVERSSIEDTPEVYQALHPMRAQNVRIAIDDLGSGLSNLDQLERIAPNVIKIDRAFVSGIDHSRPKRAIVLAMLTYASEMGVMVIAEGVENERESYWLGKLGVRFGQGYLFGRPAPLEGSED